MAPDTDTPVVDEPAAEPASAADAVLAESEAQLAATGILPASEFPSEWHRQAYIAGLEREIEGAVVRGNAEQQENAERELARVTGGGQRAAKKRPAGAAKEQRA